MRFTNVSLLRNFKFLANLALGVIDGSKLPNISNVFFEDRIFQY
jgi:hypothetical protein